MEGHAMPNVPPPADITAGPLPPPNITPLFTELLELAAAERGLPPEPWTA